jgi:hypothetical protein
MRNNYYLINKFLLEVDATNASNQKFDADKAMQTVSPNPKDTPVLVTLKQRAKGIIQKVQSMGGNISKFTLGILYRILAKIGYLTGNGFLFGFYATRYEFTTGKKLEWAQKINVTKSNPRWK